MPKDREVNEYGEAQTRVKTSLIKCPGCGANMRFNPDLQKLYCEHCRTTLEVGKIVRAKELDLSENIVKDAIWEQEENVVFHCDNCGAKVVLTGGETAKVCPFCGTSHVQKTKELAGLKPNGLLPFAFGTEKAAEYSKRWARKKLFSPRKFKKSLKAENLNGVYTPGFTFDSCTTSIFNGRIGKRRTRVVGSGKNQRTETYIEWRTVSGTYYDDFDDILITAGSKFTQKELSKLSPYNTGDSREYCENYLLGFMAYRYDRELAECWDSAKKVIDSEIRRKILEKYDCDVVDYMNISTTHENVSFKYLMLPVYVGNFTFREKVYNFFVNGTTGRV